MHGRSAKNIHTADLLVVPGATAERREDGSKEVDEDGAKDDLQPAVILGVAESNGPGLAWRPRGVTLLSNGLVCSGFRRSSGLGSSRWFIG